MKALAVAAGLVLATAAWAQKAEVDPDSAETHARAREALSRADARTLVPEERRIVGQKTDIGGLLRDLNAEVRGRETRISLSADVLFDFDKADLKPEARPQLEKVASLLKSSPKASATIEGHTDAKGDDAYNQKLSERRAESVRKWLADNGVAGKLAARGYGKKKPVAPNTTPDGKDSPEGRQKNRRVEIVVQGLAQP